MNMIKGIFWRERGGSEIFSDLAVGEYNTENYTEEELEEIIREWYKEDERDGDTDRIYWVDDWKEDNK